MFRTQERLAKLELEVERLRTVCMKLHMMIVRMEQKPLKKSKHRHKHKKVTAKKYMDDLLQRK